MSTRILLILGFSLATLHAADPTPADRLRQGLFEEEANQNFDKAAEHYRAVIAAYERQRALAATATFRLGEIARTRKTNDREAAAAAFRTVIERFPEQDELARLSRENLADLGLETADPEPPTSPDFEDAEIARLEELARDSPDLIDGAGSDGWRPIHHAAAKGHTRVLSHLLDQDVDPNGLTVTERLTPLHLAAIHGHLGAVKTLLAAKADPNVTSDFKRSVESNRFPPLDQRARLVDGQWTALDLATLYNRRAVALALIKAGADLNRAGLYLLESENWPTLNTLILAIHLQRNDLARVLIDAGASMTAVGGKTPFTPLGMAVKSNPAMIAPLLKAGADPTQPYTEKRITALHRASSSDLVEPAKQLLEAGADARATNLEEATPLHWAKSTEMAELLISKGADPNAKDKSGFSPIDYVATRDEVGSNAALLDTLLKHGASVADPRALLKRTSRAMLPLVRERLVYPETHRPDAILLSVDKFPPIRLAPSPAHAGPSQPRRVIQDSRGGHSAPVTLEVRPSEESPPPSLAEVLSMGLNPGRNPQRLRVLRRSANDRFEVIREWTPVSGTPVPADWPALEWGDIVEADISGHASSALPTIGDFADLIHDRTVRFRRGDTELPKTISGDEIFWLDHNSGETLRALIPEIEVWETPQRFAIHRDGLAEPITLDFSEPTESKFRLLDGDVVEMPSDSAEMEQSFPLTITREGMEFEGTSITKEQLENKLKNLSKNTKVWIIADPSVAYREVEFVHELCSEVGLKNVVFKSGKAEPDNGGKK
jgi:ankyrin repeat protein